MKWSRESFLVAGNAANQVPEIEITDTKVYVPVVPLSTQDNIKLPKQLESSFKRFLIGTIISLKKRIKHKTDT